MKKQYIFTKDSSFTHVKDKMHEGWHEHIIQDDETGKLYSYGSWYRLPHSSIFMSHLLKELGITGFGLAYIADKAIIDLPYSPYHREEKQILELPKDILLEEGDVDHSHKKVSEQFYKTFLGKTYELKDKEGTVIMKSGKDLLRVLFGCVALKVCYFVQKNESYPFYCIQESMEPSDIKYLIKILRETDLLNNHELKNILQKFVQKDINKSIEILENEAQVDMSEFTQELIERQEIINYFIKKHTLQIEERSLKV